MNFGSIKTGITRNISRQVLVTKKQSPHIFFGLGVVGIITSTVLACRATLKLENELDEISVDIKNMKALKVDLDAKVVNNYTMEQYRRDYIYVYTKATVKIVKLYGPSVILGTASIAALTGSHIQLTRRNTALMAAYAAVQEAFESYRGRVREQIGEEKELELYRGVQTEVIDKEKVTVGDPNKLSVYAKIFDEYSDKWEKDPELNRIFLDAQQRYANHRLQARGYLFLNEVYSALGLEMTSAGQVVGWIIGKDGDNYVDFGIMEVYNTPFINGWERSIWLDFNVDGVIYDKI